MGFFHRPLLFQSLSLFLSLFLFLSISLSFFFFVPSPSLASSTFWAREYRNDSETAALLPWNERNQHWKKKLSVDFVVVVVVVAVDVVVAAVVAGVVSFSPPFKHCFNKDPEQNFNEKLLKYHRRRINYSTEQHQSIGSNFLKKFFRWIMKSNAAKNVNQWVPDANCWDQSWYSDSS